MNGGDWGYACGFCRKDFRSLNRKLRHLKSCKEVVPCGKGALSQSGDPRRRRVAL